MLCIVSVTKRVARHTPYKRPSIQKSKSWLNLKALSSIFDRCFQSWETLYYVSIILREVPPSGTVYSVSYSGMHTPMSKRPGQEDRARRSVSWNYGADLGFPLERVRRCWSACRIQTCDQVDQNCDWYTSQWREWCGNQFQWVWKG